MRWDQLVEEKEQHLSASSTDEPPLSKSDTEAHLKLTSQVMEERECLYRMPLPREVEDWRTFGAVPD